MAINNFGGSWTENKIDVIIKYLIEYLKIMNNKNFELIYFDGFAGSGEIESAKYKNLIEGVASKVIELEKPIGFDVYYLVELNRSKKESLEKFLKDKYPEKFTQKKIYIVQADCNSKLVGLSKYLRNHKPARALAFIDPQGMQVKWKSIEIFKNLGIDLWILVPTGIGFNRLLEKNGKIPVEWMQILKETLGLEEDEILTHFYKKVEQENLFEEMEDTFKKQKYGIKKITELYRKKLSEVFTYVSIPYEMKNSVGSPMFHLILATNKEPGLKIANYIIGKKSNENT